MVMTTRAKQRSPNFGRTQSARRRTAASASGAVPARNWKTCCISGTTSSVTSTPDLRASSASLRLSSSNVIGASLDVHRRQTREIGVERIGERVAPVAALAEKHPVDWVLLRSLVIGSLPGIFFGSQLSARVPEKVLRPVLATILVIVGVRMLQA